MRYREMYHTAVFREMAAPNIKEVGVDDLFFWHDLIFCYLTLFKSESGVM